MTTDRARRCGASLPGSGRPWGRAGPEQPVVDRGDPLTPRPPGGERPEHRPGRLEDAACTRRLSRVRSGAFAHVLTAAARCGGGDSARGPAALPRRLPGTGLPRPVRHRWASGLPPGHGGGPSVPALQAVTRATAHPVVRACETCVLSMTHLVSVCRSADVAVVCATYVSAHRTGRPRAQRSDEAGVPADPERRPAPPARPESERKGRDEQRPSHRGLGPGPGQRSGPGPGQGSRRRGRGRLPRHPVSRVTGRRTVLRATAAAPRGRGARGDAVRPGRAPASHAPGAGDGAPGGGTGRGGLPARPRPHTAAGAGGRSRRARPRLGHPAPRRPVRPPDGMNMSYGFC